MGVGKEAQKSQVKDKRGGAVSQRGSSLHPSCRVLGWASPPTCQADPAVDPMPNDGFSSEQGEKPCCNLSKKAKIGLGIFLFLCVLVVVTVVLVVLIWLQAPKQKEWNGPGTTPHFAEIVLGRCYTYTQVLRPELR